MQLIAIFKQINYELLTTKTICVFKKLVA